MTASATLYCASNTTGVSSAVGYHRKLAGSGDTKPQTLERNAHLGYHELFHWNHTGYTQPAREGTGTTPRAGFHRDPAARP